ncbi:MAG: hypothetical protein JO092_07910, partial [Candidatus Eremiobacteraeota bacterium]|nr:hypothetical protein [Candidatus Eremiobacteraeota bacterium]
MSRFLVFAGALVLGLMPPAIALAAHVPPAAMPVAMPAQRAPLPDERSAPRPARPVPFEPKLRPTPAPLTLPNQYPWQPWG